MPTARTERVGSAGKGPKAPNSLPENRGADRRESGVVVAASAQTRSQPRSEPSPAAVEQIHLRETSGGYSALSIDRAFKAHLARFTLGLSPAGIVSKYFEWFLHLMISPGKQLELIEKAQHKTAQFMVYAASSARDPSSPPCIEPLPLDRRFNHESWRSWPYSFAYQSFLLTQQWWHNATNDIDGLSRKDEEAISFVTRQMLDLFSPSNFVLTNPEIVNATLAQSGNNLVRGFQNFIEDWQRATTGKPPVGAERFVVGKEVAITPGKVIYRNHLIELIQYSPATEEVHAEPILIVPAWIMKYYILDLSPTTIFNSAWRVRCRWSMLCCRTERFMQWAIASAALCSRSRQRPWRAIATTS